MFEEFEVIKDPDEIKDYGINWLPTLGTDTINTSVWSIVVGTGLVINSDSHDATGTVVWLSGGTKGVTYQLRNRITTNNAPPRTYDMTVKLRCAEK